MYDLKSIAKEYIAQNDNEYLYGKIANILIQFRKIGKIFYLFFEILLYNVSVRAECFTAKNRHSAQIKNRRQEK